MKLFFVLLMTGICFVRAGWLTDMAEAQRRASSERKHILLNFSGSDWCGPCIMLRKQVFDEAVFMSMADSSLILVNADFPRMRKNQLEKVQQQANDRLADKYNPQGKFPLTLLLTADGSVIRQWEGNPGLTAPAFVSQLRSAIGGAGR